MQPVEIQAIRLLCLENYRRIKVNNINFNSFKFTNRKDTIIGVSDDELFLIKISTNTNSKKNLTIEGEYKLLKSLNEKGCQSCPKVYSFGTISKENISSLIDDKKTLQEIPGTEFQYILQEYVPDDKRYNLADIVFSLLEQKSLGVYHGDIKPANIRFSSKKGICCFIDYDQAFELNDEQSSLSNEKFFKFCSQYDKDKYGIGNWLRHFSEYSEDDLPLLLKKDSFDLKNTSVLNTQVTTNTQNGIYHSLQENKLFIDGNRGIDLRASALKNVDFKPGETVLDIGCNMGLLSWYLESRGCSVVGVDNDPHIIVAANMISNILDRKSKFACVDLDAVKNIKEFDTIMLFSVLHHTRDVVANAKKISSSCSRIILEARPYERGKQPAAKGDWYDTSTWNFPSIDKLIDYCEVIFEGFKLKNNLGLIDKNRYILEFVK